MIRPGHLPKLETHVAKAIQSIQKLSDEEREKLLGILIPVRALLNEQAAFNRRISDSIQDSETTFAATTDSLVPHFMFAGS